MWRLNQVDGGAVRRAGDGQFIEMDVASVAMQP
jgi:hypothetical protein